MSTAAATVSVTGIAYTTYPVRDVRRARSFYEQQLGLRPTATFERAGRQRIEYRIGAGTLMITDRSEDGRPSPQGAVVALQVRSLATAVAALHADRRGLVTEPVMLPSFQFALAADPDGNRIMLYERTTPRRRQNPLVIAPTHS